MAFTTPDLSDAHPVGPRIWAFSFVPLAPRESCGPVSTIACDADNSRVAEAVAEPGNGRVLLVDGQGALHRSLLGDRLAQLASDNGWAGVVVIGAIRDVEVIDGIDIGVQALGVCPVKTDKQGVGDRDIPDVA
ncbi:MAG: putative 4-hydroxy-4-methyl-2-oxoglutarate aldolase [Gammaproteobacteria bacterium]|nr:MAG: putative 4-hydroxy-4-methyl-2-oxoglutarate aldolase [Gammaproteobacteria bacterium]